MGTDFRQPCRPTYLPTYLSYLPVHDVATSQPANRTRQMRLTTLAPLLKQAKAKAKAKAKAQAKAQAQAQATLCTATSLP